MTTITCAVRDHLLMPAKETNIFTMKQVQKEERVRCSTCMRTLTSEQFRQTQWRKDRSGRRGR